MRKVCGNLDHLSFNREPATRGRAVKEKQRPQKRQSDEGGKENAKRKKGPSAARFLDDETEVVDENE